MKTLVTGSTTNLMNLNSFIAISCALLLLSGCAGQRLSPQQRSSLEGPARAQESRGDWQAAANEWQKAATRVKGDLAAEMQLNAAAAMLRAGDSLGASQLVSSLPSSLSENLSLRRALILAEASLLSGEPIAALQRLGPELRSSDPAVLSHYRRIRSDALELTGDLMGAVRERSLRDAILNQGEERYRNRQHIWRLLAQIPTQQLDTQALQPGSAQSGWVELASVTRANILDIEQLDAAIAQWSFRYPGHPAGEQIVPELIEQAHSAAQPPQKVALLLPQTGPFEGASAAIREGFMAAWFADAPNENRPEIMLIDTHASDPALAYDNAINSGAQFVIGPLEKESVRAVINNSDLKVTTLALNYPADEAPVNDTTSADASSAPTTAIAESEVNVAEPGPQEPPQKLYFFALAPEDEARQAADFAFEHGARQAGVMVAEGAWGERIGSAFAEHWQQLGGVIATRATFSEQAQGLSQAVEDMLNIGQSKERAKQLRATLVRNFKFDPQPRSDMDVVFMAAFPQDARQLKPLLRFHRATKVPVIATSHVYAGVPDSRSDIDLNGVLFGEMPWLMSPQSYSLPGQAQQLWANSGGALGRLYAFGADSYALIARLRELRVVAGSSFAGLSGQLSLNKQHQVQRVPQWSRFDDGLAHPLDSNTLGASLDALNTVKPIDEPELEQEQTPQQTTQATPSAPNQ